MRYSALVIHTNHLVTYRVALFNYKEQQHYLKLNISGFLVFWYKNNIT